MIRYTLRLCAVLIALAAMAAALASAAAAGERHSYIVVFEDHVAAPAALASSQVRHYRGELGFVYRYAIKGYSAELPKAAVPALERDPRVDYVSDGEVPVFAEEIGLETEDHQGVELEADAFPTGIRRTFATANKGLDIDGVDDVRANVDVAVIDTGIDQTHPDLNVVARTDCTGAGESCLDNTGTDENTHGTHVAGTIAALDNGFGVVGMAPGARLWSVKVLGGAGGNTVEDVIAGVDWVTAHSSEIEVANMSLSAREVVPALNEAVAKSAEKGIVYTLAAGNQAEEVRWSPATTEAAITVSGIADYDGQPGGKSAPTCVSRGADDSRYTLSNYGPLVDIAAPAVCILSTEPGNKYGLKSGTSMAAPHVAGAAAILAAKENPNSLKDVEAIAAKLEETGNHNWTDTSGDGIQEPLLDVGSEWAYGLGPAPIATTGAVNYVGVGSATETLLTGTVNPKLHATKYQFELVEAGKYKPGAENPYSEGSKVPLSPTSLAGTLDKNYEVEAAVTGLNSNTVYHYRLVAENGNGISRGADQSFTSAATCKGSGGQCGWTLQSAANPEPRTENELEDVSCPSSTVCMAVGNDRYRGKGLVEAWDGSGWEIVSSSLGEMRAISCPSATWCAVVAKSEGSGWQVKWVKTVLNEEAWRVEAKSPPAPEGGTEVRLRDVSCSSESACTLVGRYSASGILKTYVARWNGSGWALQTAPSPADAGEAMLSVSCASSTSCTTVGKSGNKPYVARWNGSEWATQTAANPEGSTDVTLESVSCPTASACMAVGNYTTASGRKTLAERWNGSSWSLTSSANPAKEGHALLRGVSCLSASSCLAVGYFRAPTMLVANEETLLAESWNGSTWTLQSSPNPEGKTFSSFAAVSCSSASACTAVGKARPERLEVNMVTLAERWG
ncbi:MAG TPA: S8 family serine peptidase [Solirubrobacterales bacterium]|nr:S8 family serine peptidase [Solirubrobacterales bacterium]